MVGSDKHLRVRFPNQQVLLPLELVRVSNWSCCLFPRNKRYRVGVLVERRGRRFPEAASSPCWSEDSFARSACEPLLGYHVASADEDSLHSFENSSSALSDADLLAPPDSPPTPFVRHSALVARLRRRCDSSWQSGATTPLGQHAARPRATVQAES